MCFTDSGLQTVLLVYLGTGIESRIMEAYSIVLSFALPWHSPTSRLSFLLVDMVTGHSQLLSLRLLFLIKYPQSRARSFQSHDGTAFVLPLNLFHYQDHSSKTMIFLKNAFQIKRYGRIEMKNRYENSIGVFLFLFWRNTKRKSG